ncbi:hypothetical protein [Burkholderia sp. WSM2230]|uniref:hypothetical protein n=1 Tax=Burkholderia sp. WSM2230 TaxID=944435 RepID=UPI000472069D|nr:hypothetical protein [Burkholderia sp. WSM2230]
MNRTGRTVESYLPARRELHRRARRILAAATDATHGANVRNTSLPEHVYHRYPTTVVCLSEAGSRQFLLRKLIFIAPSLFRLDRRAGPRAAPL